MATDADSVDAGSAGAAIATVNIRSSNGSKFSVQISLDVTIAAFKVAVAEKCDVPAEQQRLIYKGRILKDDQTLLSYGVESDHTIHLVRGAAPTSANLGASGVPNNTSGTTAGAGPNDGQGFGAGPNDGQGFGAGAGFGSSLFPGLGVNGLDASGVSGLFGTGLPEFDQVQQQLSQNPNMMREIMNLPAIQNLMSNPDLLRNMIMSNPQMRELLDRNPDLAHVLNDPNTMRQTLEAARNPELMREMMRNTDRAMSNIESSPEGFNMLRRMYETVQEPFLNATTMAGDTGNNMGSNPFAALLGNQGTTQSTDRSPNPSTTSSEATGNPAPNTNPLPNPWNSATGGAQTAGTRPPPATDARAPSIAGLGGIGLPGLSAMPDRLNQVLENPAMAQMMQTLLSNPQYINQILGSNPQTRTLLESNPQIREMLQSPEFLRQLSSPETLQSLQSFNQSLFSQFGRQQPTMGQNQTAGGTGAANPLGLEALMNMFGGLGVGDLGVPNSNTSNVPPEELYATQLSQLQEMGFYDTQENIRALSATGGNVHAAVDRLLGNLNFGQ